ncbi:hypothetical protein VOLCADRAFT_103286 [Volvox carteri f. nagariensis]|uniref:Patatin n=1 Tax=Volvox carteri f. nagariensis TaxID=3068 RepID=D8TKZ8_VOLCA|nr:uncharacterized protein VOLCADRAFT_103286 [Volvox carteri f. nagariensis]EFJ51786.1 hypothetical protein VOLCADRAFT_103286 [Volvox carteri f. nagariensis]|eukprot:XP_002947196.1 hypothetical protein VOLCADRAFT_103286 [Volvox carteri f. nagariensis]
MTRDVTCHSRPVRSLAITFSGGGFLLPYFIGVADTLLQLGVLRIGNTATTYLESVPSPNPDSNPGPGSSSDGDPNHSPHTNPGSEPSKNTNPTTDQSLSPSPLLSPPLSPTRPTPLAGSSAGSLIAVSLACGLTPTRILDSFLDSVHDCRTNGSYRRLEEVLLRQLQASLPADAAERCAGVATVSVTHLFPRPRTRRVSSFASREDLIRALMASCHIPTYFNGDVTTTFRGKRTVDGGVTELLPTPVASHAFLLKVCCFPRQQVARLPIFNRARALHQLDLGISPDAFGPWPYNFRYMLAAALHPRSYRFIRVLLEAGRNDAGRWAVAAGIAEPNQLSGLTPLQLPAVLLQQPVQQPPDVGPGAGASADATWTPEAGETPLPKFITAQVHKGI